MALFVQAMLSKTADVVQIYKYYFNNSITQGGSTGSYQTLYSFTVDRDITLDTSLSYTSGSVNFFVNTNEGVVGDADDNGEIMTVHANRKNYSGKLTVTAGTTVYLRMYSDSSTTGKCSANIRGILNNLYKNTSVPFGLPLKSASLGNFANIIIYGIIKTNYINTKLFLSNLLMVTNVSNNNNKSYLGETDDRGNILFDGLELKPSKLPATNKERIINTGNMQTTKTVTIEKDGFITYSIRGSSTGTTNIKINGLYIYEAGTTTFFSSIPVIKGDVIQVNTASPNSSYSVEGVVDLFAYN